MCREAEPCEGPEAILEHHLYLTRFFVYVTVNMSGPEDVLLLTMF